MRRKGGKIYLSMEGVKEALEAAVKDLFGQSITVELTRPEEQFGDYSTNAAMQMGAKLGKNPRQIAERIKEKLANEPTLAKVEVAGPGFINLTLSDETLAKLLAESTNLPIRLEGQEILVEFGDPNPFKEMHIGHLYSYIVGDSIATLLQAAGADVKRLSYHGDVGLHVAEAIWGMKKLGSEAQVGTAYAAGAKAYEEDESAKREIDDINEYVYKKDDAEINRLYEQGKKSSFEGFDQTLHELGIKNDRRYLESESASVGVEYVKDNVGKVFEESDGAIIYKGEKVGLHTRVFLTSQRLPTYESKDLGLAELKNRDYPKAERSIVITAHEQAEYFKVMLAALAEIDEALAKKTIHLTHGFLSLSTGKMSSRSGDVYSADQLLANVREEALKQYPDSAVVDQVSLAAVKYSFLKHRLGQDIVVDVQESVSLEGNSGPYLQYAHARAGSILARVGSRQVAVSSLQPANYNLQPSERSLAKKISEYPEVVAKATAELMPHYICTYLYELAQTFNHFYEENRVLNDAREAVRLELVSKYADVLKHGLGLLNIAAPEKM